MTDGTVTSASAFDLPYGRHAELRRVSYDSGLEMLRLVLREGRRITIVELDRDAAAAMAADMAGWAGGAD